MASRPNRGDRAPPIMEHGQRLRVFSDDEVKQCFKPVGRVVTTPQQGNRWWESRKSKAAQKDLDDLATAETASDPSSPTCGSSSSGSPRSDRAGLKEEVTLEDAMRTTPEQHFKPVGRVVVTTPPQGKNWRKNQKKKAVQKAKRAKQKELGKVATTTHSEGAASGSSSRSRESSPLGSPYADPKKEALATMHEAEKATNMLRVAEAARREEVIKLNEKHRCAEQELQQQVDFWRNKACGLQMEVSTLQEHLKVQQKKLEDTEKHHHEVESKLREDCAAAALRVQQMETEVLPSLKQKLTAAEAALRQQTENEDLLAALHKDLLLLCCCPISLEPMKQPVMGSDCRTYEKDIIEKALLEKPASPFTRTPMRKAMLRPNMLATDLLELIAKHFPATEASMVKPTRRPAPVGAELVAAIRAGRSEEALDMLGRDVHPLVLNGCMTDKGEQVTLLLLSLRYGLPDVAVAIVLRPDFKRSNARLKEGHSALHVAACFGYADVCLELLKDLGPMALTVRTDSPAVLIDPQGHAIEVPEDMTPVDCARLRGHDYSWATRQR